MVAFLFVWEPRWRKGRGDRGAELLQALHVTCAVRQEAEVEAAVELLRVVGDESDAFEVPDVGVFENALDQPRSQTSSAPLLGDEDITQIGVGHKVGDHPGDADLPLAFPERKAERVAQSAFERLWSQLRPPVCICEKLEDLIEVEEGGVGGYEKAPPLAEKIIHILHFFLLLLWACYLLGRDSIPNR